MNPQSSIVNRQSSILNPPSCYVCEWSLGVRGECPGNEGHRPCPAFQMATNRQGSVSLETGDELHAETLGELHGEKALPLTSPLSASSSPAAATSAGDAHGRPAARAPLHPPAPAVPDPRREQSRVGICGSGPQAPSSPPQLDGAAAGLDFLKYRAARGCGPDADGVGFGLLTVWLVLGGVIAVLGSSLAAGELYPERNGLTAALRTTKADLAGEAVSSSFPVPPGRSDPYGSGETPGNGRRGMEGTDARAGRRGESEHSAPAVVSGSQLARFLAAVRQVESQGNDRAVGDHGKSRGPYQIQLAYWIDGGGDPARYLADVWNPALCRPVIVAYWRRYCPAALARGDWATLARFHNGGPGAWKTNKAAAYARRVVARMKAAAA